MAISSPGIGSGLDVNSIVSKLMSVEQQPLMMLAQKEASYNAKLSGFGQLKSVLSQFQATVSGLSDPAQFNSLNVNIGDTTIATATAGTGAAQGNYALEVTNLAQVQKLVSAGQTNSTAAIGTGASTTLSFDFGTIAGGTLTNGTYTGASFASSGSGIKTVTLDNTNNSLSGIRDAINQANIGVTATIINDGSATPYRLALTTTSTGQASSMKIAVAGDASLSSLLSQDPANNTGQAFSENLTAKNANFKIDGVAITKTTNTVTDAIQGVTLNLLKANIGTPTNIAITLNTAAINTSVTQFVKAYNNINQNLKDATAYNATTKTAAILNGEASVRAIQTQIRNVLTVPVAGGVSPLTTLSQAGITVQKDGSLLIDNTKLQAAITANPTTISALFAAAGKTTDSLVSYSGTTAKTQAGAYNLFVSQMATQGTATATAAAGLTITAGVNDTLQVQLDGTSATVKLAAGTYATAASLATQIQASINGASAFTAVGNSATVTADATGILKITSNRYSSASNANISGGNGQANLNFVGATLVAGKDVAGTINGLTAIGSGQFLTGAIGDASEGLKIQINGGSLGARGTVNYSQGYAYQFNTLATNFLGTTGPLSSATDGINASLLRLAKDKDVINTQLAATEARYRAQFTALDATISSMNATSNYLAQQLANLPKLA